MHLRAAFSKNQTGSDSDVGKNHPKSYIFVHYLCETPHTSFFFSTPLRFRFTEDQSFGDFDTFFS